MMLKCLCHFWIGVIGQRIIEIVDDLLVVVNVEVGRSVYRD